MNKKLNLQSALVDGLGTEVASLFEVVSFESRGKWVSSARETLLVKSTRDPIIYLLIDDSRRDLRMTRGWYLDIALEIGDVIGEFVVPSQSLRGKIYWGGESHGPIQAFRFAIL